MTRDPRTDPHPGDVLRNDRDFGCESVTITYRVVRRRLARVGFLAESADNGPVWGEPTIEAWQDAMADAEVVTTAP